MHGTPDTPDHVHTVWDDNAQAWIKMVREDLIPSRVAVTNNAILASIASRAPHTVLDIGCGEGWLCREVKIRIGSETVGLDGSASLIAAALEEEPTGVYAQASYEALIGNEWPEPCWEGTFDVIVFNFALFENEISPLLKAAATRLAPQGAILIQTLTTEILKDGPPGWRHERFEGFGKGRWTPMDWYCHDLASLTAGIEAAGLQVSQVIQTKPRGTDGAAPVSMMIAATQA